MSLPARQQRVLDGIEGALRASEPHMAAMFAMFAQLTRDDGPATAERLRVSRMRAVTQLRGLALIPVMVAMLIVGVVLGGSGRGSAGCATGRIAGSTLTGAEARIRAVCGTRSQPAGSAKPVKPVKPATAGLRATPIPPGLMPAGHVYDGPLPAMLQIVLQISC
jgi:hypothetical protein